MRSPWLQKRKAPMPVCSNPSPNAVGHAISRNAAGRVILKVYVEKDARAARAALPTTASGFPVVVERTGKIVAF